MRKLRLRRPASLDLDHMRLLHHEAIEQLELMRTAIEAAEQASDGMRDNLDEIALNHWHAYMDIIHKIWVQFIIYTAMVGIIFIIC